VTVAAMALSMGILVVYSALMEGYLRDMEASVLDYEVGDLQVVAAGYRDDPSLYSTIESPEPLLEALEREGLRAAPRLLAFGLAASGDSSAAASFRGLDLERDAQVTKAHEQLEAGRWLVPGDDRGAVVGRRLARMLGLQPGGELLVLSQGGDGSMAYDLFTVRGVLRGIGEGTDRTGVFITEAAFRELFVVPTGTHLITVRRPAELPLDAAALRVRAAAPEGLEVQTWRELFPTAASMLDAARGATYVVYLIAYVAVAILVLNAMLMTVFERVRELGVVKAIGAGPLLVLRLIFLEAYAQAGLAIAIGLAAALPALIYLSVVGIDMGRLGGLAVMGIAMRTIWTVELTPGAFLAPVLTLIVMVSLATVYPALKAAWLDPVQAIRHR
jgi:ABC-type lipoprotein release transport system permease subunit